jgi:hypothetical protein
MACVHLRQLYNLCKDNDLKLGGADLIRVVCRQCGEQEVCPSTLMDEYDTTRSQPVVDTNKKPAEDSAP